MQNGQEPKMSSYISGVEVSLNDSQEQQLLKQGFTKIKVDVSQGVGPNRSYIWFKMGSEAITRIQLTYMQDMQPGLISEGYNKIDKNLNPGSGDYINLWFYRGHLKSDVPIVELSVTNNPKEEAQMFGQGFERLACDLTLKTGGNRVYLWMKREVPTYICDVTVTDNFGADADYFQKGYIRMDRGVGGAYIFMWYLQTTDAQQALKDLQISTKEEEYQRFKSQHYDLVSVKLSDESAANSTYLWYKRDDRIRDLAMILDSAAVVLYEEAGVKVIDKNLGKGVAFLCFYC
ncbi:uncharacterized protein LOC125890889 isoform X1 [Epinephelus fuscoguttatus]|uniref:uncharacterized protein LOC125890889 isoform X1 n=2 Tax=Epinephelus fuscoguttatus TaxID=293821 RepID=UPI0020D12344|nr:uncharacterized protein LOC125890889 isoform X1 [Epinephelus fuscoguttatus]